MEIKWFKDIQIGNMFTFGDLDYIKVENNMGLSLGGLRIFNLMERISIKTKGY